MYLVASQILCFFLEFILDDEGTSEVPTIIHMF